MKKYKKLIMITKITKARIFLSRLKTNRKNRFKKCRFEKISE